MSVVDMSDPNFLFDRACEVLAAAEACLVSQGIDLPDNRYVSACDPDLVCCSTLAVKPDIIVPINQDAGKCIYQRELHFRLWVARCIVVFTVDGHLPPIGNCEERECGTITGDAATILADRWALTMCLLPSLCDLAEVDPIPPWRCNKTRFSQIEPLCEGNCAGTTFEITLTV